MIYILCVLLVYRYTDVFASELEDAAVARNARRKSMGSAQSPENSTFPSSFEEDSDRPASRPQSPLNYSPIKVHTEEHSSTTVDDFDMFYTNKQSGTPTKAPDEERTVVRPSRKKEYAVSWVFTFALALVFSFPMRAAVLRLWRLKPFQVLLRALRRTRPK